MAIKDKRVVTIIIEQRLEIDNVDSMSKIIIHNSLPVEIDIDHVMDRIRELLEIAKQNNFTFL